jgi:serine/threonine-protein phosphatase 2A regulatory subunit B
MDKLQQSKGSSYKLSQMFGYKGPNEKIIEEDVISVIKFDPTGKFLSVGDKAGRVILFSASETTKKKEIEYEYYAEFQSHAKEFDPLRSMDIEEEITGITWMRPQGKYMKMATCNNKSIKLWKIY